MTGADDYLRALLDRAAAEDAFIDALRPTNDARPNGAAVAPAASPAMSLMITNRQRVDLRALGFSDDAIRQMTPAEAHALVRNDR